MIKTDPIARRPARMRRAGSAGGRETVALGVGRRPEGSHRLWPVTHAVM